MKVLFAVSNDDISNQIVKMYRKEYKEIIQYKNVYYWNSILKELQKDKSYDRIVISEDLEPFANKSYENIDKFIFETLDRITDEAIGTNGIDTPIILICTDRRTKSESILVKIFGIGIYSALLGPDRTQDNVCKLLNKPRSKKEAKLYYKIDSDDVNYQVEKENTVNEVELQNILNHYKKLGKNEDKFVESFNNIAEQYNDEQLKIIIAYLPLNVKVVLETESRKYQELMTFGTDRKKASVQIAKQKKEALQVDYIPISETEKKKSKVIVPTTITPDKIKKVSKNNKKEETEKNTESVSKKEKDVVKNNIKENKTKNQDNIIDNKNEEIISEPVKKKRGRPKKIQETDEFVSNENIEIENPKNEEETAKKRRGRPKKNVDAKDLKKKVLDDDDNDEIIAGVNDNVYEEEEKIIPEANYEEDDDEIIPEIEDEEDDDEIISGIEEEDDDDEIIPGIEDEEEEEEDDDDNDEIISGIEDEEEEEDDDDDEIIPGIEDEEEEEDDDDDEIIPEIEDEEEEEDDDDDEIIPEIEDEEDDDEIIPEIEDEEEDDDEIIPGIDDDEYNSKDEKEFDEEDDVEYSNKAGKRMHSQKRHYNDQFLNDEDEEEDDDDDELPGIEDDDLENNQIKNVNYRGIQKFGLTEDIQKIDKIKKTKQIEKSDKNTYSEDLQKLLTNEKKMVAFIGTSKNGTSFIVNNLAEMFSKNGIKTAILDMTKNKNSFYIYTNNDEKLRQTAYSTMDNLRRGQDQGIKVNSNLTLYTDFPSNEIIEDSNIKEILSTIVTNNNIVLIDCDFDTPLSIMQNVQEIYLVQSMDILTIQPLTAYLRDLQAKDINLQEKIRIIINKAEKIRGLNEKTIIGGMAFYNDPSMSIMKELFDKDKVKYCVIPFEEQTYIRYLEGILNCEITLKGYSKKFLAELKKLSNIVYPLVNGKRTNVTTAKYVHNNAFSSNMSSTLEKMKKKY